MLNKIDEEQDEFEYYVVKSNACAQGTGLGLSISTAEVISYS